MMRPFPSSLPLSTKPSPSAKTTIMTDLELELASLVVPEVDAAEEAGRSVTCPTCGGSPGTWPEEFVDAPRRIRSRMQRLTASAGLAPGSPAPARRSRAAAGDTALTAPRVRQRGVPFVGLPQPCTVPANHSPAVSTRHSHVPDARPRMSSLEAVARTGAQS